MAKKWKAFVEADCALGSIPGETSKEAREYIKNNIDTGDLGPIKIRGIEEDE